MRKILFVVVLMSFIGCTKEKTVKITYTVMCDCKAQGFTISYVDANKNVTHETIGKDIWEKELIAKTGDNLFILSQGNNTNATIVARIYHNGAIVEANKKQGDYPVAIATIYIKD